MLHALDILGIWIMPGIYIQYKLLASCTVYERWQRNCRKMVHKHTEQNKTSMAHAETQIAR